MTGIYKITSPTNKVYIGQSINITNRKTYYKNLHCKSQPKLYRSLKKYGWEQHKFEIIEECSIELLDEKEIYWKQHYNSIKEGLNCGLFDMGGGPKSNETKTRMSKAKKGNQYRVGSKMSDESKHKISKANSKPKPEGFKEKFINNKERGYKIAISKHKPVLQYDLEGNFIREWNSAKEAELYFGREKSDNIAGCCRGISKTAYKHKWIYK